MNLKNKVIDRLVAFLLSLKTKELRKPNYRWYEPQTAEEAMVFLAERCFTKSKGCNVLVIANTHSEIELFQNELMKKSRDLIVESILFEEDFFHKKISESKTKVIVSLDFSAKRVHALASFLKGHEVLSQTPFEYCILASLYNTLIKEKRFVQSERLIGPNLINDVDLYRIFEESLQFFPHKTCLADYMDVVQCLERVITNEVGRRYCRVWFI